MPTESEDEEEDEEEPDEDEEEDETENAPAAKKTDAKKDGKEEAPSKKKVKKVIWRVGHQEIYQGLWFGVGKGTFFIILAVVVGIMFCICKNSSPMPTCLVLVGFLIPLTVFGIIYSLPIKGLKTDKDRKDTIPVDTYILVTYVFYIVIIIACLFLFVFTWAGSLANSMYAKRVDTSEPVQTLATRRAKNIDEMDLVLREHEAENEINDQIALEEAKKRLRAQQADLGYNPTDELDDSMRLLGNRGRFQVRP